MSFHTHLCGQSLVSAFAQQVLDDAVVVLLRRHVERREAVETLHVHDCGTLHQDTRHLLLPSCRTKPQKENILVCCCRDGRYKKPPLIIQISLAIIMHLFLLYHLLARIGGKTEVDDYCVVLTI